MTAESTQTAEAPTLQSPTESPSLVVDTHRVVQPSEEWLRKAYELAWEQYAHEDELRHHKNTLYIGIQTALFAILPTSVIFLIGTRKHEILGITIDTPTLVIGLLFMGTAIFGLLINGYWENVIRSGRAWMYLRYATARAIEHRVGLSDFGLAAMEHKWDVHCKTTKESRRHLDKRTYYPFAHIEELKDFALYRKTPIGESHAALGIVRTLNIMWLLVICIGTTAVVECLLQVFSVIP